jgi:hypothetical protein
MPPPYGGDTVLQSRIRELEGALVQAKRTNEQILHSKYDPLQISVDERMSLMENTLNQLKQVRASPVPA